jgi:hypothetical protein
MTHGMAVDESPSYVTLPPDLGQVQCSGMSTVDASVLNMSMVCVPGPAASPSLLVPHVLCGASASATAAASASSRKSASATSLKAGTVSVEDQRIELEVLIESVVITRRKLERALSGDRAATALSAFDLKPIDMMYGSVIDMGEALRANLSVVGPVVLDRLRQREQELRESKKELEKLWSTKRFVRKDGVVNSPRSWLRRELVAELLAAEKSAAAARVAGSVAAVLAEAGTADGKDADAAAAGVEDKDDKDVTMEDAAGCSSDKVGDVSSERATVVKYRVDEKDVDDRTVVTSMLVSQKENAQVLFDLLAFMLDWELDEDAGAKRVCDLMRDVYTAVRSRGPGGVVYADEYLYHIVRLVSALSERIGYILSHDYDGVAVTRVLEAVSAVLEGSMSMVAWEQVCAEVYGDGRRWEVLLADFPILLRRFAAQAIKLDRRALAMALFDLAKAQASGNSVRETMMEDYQSKAMDLVLGPNVDDAPAGHLVRISVGDTVEPSAVDRRKPEEFGALLSYEIVRRPAVAEWLPFSASDKTAEAEVPEVAKFASLLQRYAMRTKKRSVADANVESDAGVVLLLGLGARVHVHSGRLSYIADTEDVFARAKRRRRERTNPSATKDAVLFHNWLERGGRTGNPTHGMNGSAGGSHAATDPVHTQLAAVE